MFLRLLILVGLVWFVLLCFLFVGFVFVGGLVVGWVAVCLNLFGHASARCIVLSIAFFVCYVFCCPLLLFIVYIREGVGSSNYPIGI